MSHHFVILARENGPYLISGEFTYLDVQGNPQKTEGKMIALCRCGQSGNKPFCDGTHKKVGFVAPALELKLTDDTHS
ncbi:MAG: CDGSH iron-sulfur domain-containing protein [Anaerolineales bacterium]|nr:CDGSH iron-sulfur domain-containing protein [Anaerolineales bacterium]MCX7608239.1 CDGSH iron-sulfur domain-containing protein [Anaerolineales bacterium]